MNWFPKMNYFEPPYFAWCGTTALRHPPKNAPITQSILLDAMTSSLCLVTMVTPNPCLLNFTTKPDLPLLYFCLVFAVLSAFVTSRCLFRKQKEDSDFSVSFFGLLHPYIPVLCPLCFGIKTGWIVISRGKEGKLDRWPTILIWISLPLERLDIRHSGQSPSTLVGR